MGLPEASDALVTSTTPEPTTIDEAMTAMKDGFRSTLLNAGRTARSEAIATMPLWWDQLPETVRNNVSFRVDAWRRDHPRATTAHLAGVRFDLFLQAMQRENCVRGGGHYIGSRSDQAGDLK